MRTTLAIAALGVWLGAVSVGRGQECAFSWSTDFGAGNFQLYPPEPVDLQAFTSATLLNGDRLYVGGEFTSIGGSLINGVSEWNGSRWARLGAGLGAGARVNALTVHDDGPGPALIAGGSFGNAGALPALNIAAWNGRVWRPLGAGLSGLGASVSALATYDFQDGAGPKLVAGGRFDGSGGTTISNIAAWDGTKWTPLGAGLPNEVRCVGVFHGPGGDQMFASQSASAAIYRWTGAGWDVAPGLEGFVQVDPANFLFFDDGTARLFAAGRFQTTSGVHYSVLAWDGTSWAPANDGLPRPPGGLTGRLSRIRIDGIERLVVALESDTQYEWQGGDWAIGGWGAQNSATRLLANFPSNSSSFYAMLPEDVGTLEGTWVRDLASRLGLNSSCFALATSEAKEGRRAWIGGHFQVTVRREFYRRICIWDGGSSYLPPLGEGLSREVLAIATTPDDPDAAYLGGAFRDAVGESGDYVVRWSGTEFTEIGNLDGRVAVLAFHDDGSGNALYAGGLITGGIARWDGANWNALDAGPSSRVFATAIYDDGFGPALYASGQVRTPDDQVTYKVARWDGTNWHPVGIESQFDYVVSLEVFDDGSGEKLYAGGKSTALGSGIARWDGVQWEPVGNSVNFDVTDLTPYTMPGVGEVLVAVGRRGGESMAFWDGVAWTTVPGAPYYVDAVTVWGEGDQAGLLIGGDFHGVDGIASSHIAYWRPGPPIVSSISSAKRFVRGQSGALSVDAMGSAALAYQWYHGDQPLSDGGGLSGTQTDTLTFTNFQPADVGTYWVELTDDCGTSASPGILVGISATPGDMNCDGSVSVADINGFVQALIAPNEYSLANPTCDVNHADVNLDFRISVTDINGFVELLMGP